MRTEQFDYDLPSGLIAQEPADPRDSSRLLVLDRSSGQIDHRAFKDILGYLRPGDVLVVNETRVLPARLRGTKEDTGGAVEVLLLRERYKGTWECLVKPGRKLKPGTKVVFGDGVLAGLVVEDLEESGGRLVQFHTAGGSLIDAFHQVGEMPLPPYISKPLKDPERYQTVFARDERSVAAPTAGLHFTHDLLASAEAAGVQVARVELDVGLDSFRPVPEDDPLEHPMHGEHMHVSERAASIVNRVRDEGGRVIAVGTSSVRALESAAEQTGQGITPMEGSTDLYILPGHRFQAVDALITNFHMPRSTLLMLVSAFAGRDLVMGAYDAAKREGYRFLSFGDAMLIL